MKTYEGKRSIDGLQVTVDGQPLPEHYEVKQFTTWGFEWTYEGASPQQLALAILYDHLGDGPRAIRLSDPFMKKIVADMGPIDILVNNVGNRENSVAIKDDTLESWQDTIDRNLTSCFLGTRIG